MQCPKCETQIDIAEEAQEQGWNKPREHTWYKCDPPHAEYGCQFCDGGLGLCTICGGFEGQLTTECCGEKLSTETLDKVYACKIDFIGNKWITKILEDWRKVPSVEWLANFLKPCEHNRVDAKDVAQALHDAMLGKCQSCFSAGRCDIDGELCKVEARGEKCNQRNPQRN